MIPSDGKSIPSTNSAKLWHGKYLSLSLSPCTHIYVFERETERHREKNWVNFGCIIAESEIKTDDDLGLHKCKADFKSMGDLHRGFKIKIGEGITF